MNRVFRRAGAFVSTLLLVGLLPGARVLAQTPAPAEEEAPVVERVEIQGNQYLQKETLLFYISTKAGDRYDERRLKDDYRRLWDTGFLDDLVLDVRDSPQGKIVSFRVTERKRIQIIDYRGSKALTTTNIEDELKKEEEGLKIDTFYDPAKARKVEGLIKQMLAAKGYPFATVKHEAKAIGGAGEQVSFVITDGPKARIKEIDFVGNTQFSDATLAKQLKKIKASGFFNLSWMGGKSTYTEDKWNGTREDPGDASRLSDFFLNRGYVMARVGQPKVTYIENPKAEGGKKPKKDMHLEIPVTEGAQFRVGEIKFEGLTVFKEEGIRTLFKLQPGEVYNDSKIKKGYDKLRDAYGSQGYFQWTGSTHRRPDLEKKVVDVTLSMDEDKRYYVGRITFTGNESTRDKVIRREVYLNEGDVFNTEMLKFSIKRINQLGYFKPMEGAPDLRPSEKAEDKLDVTFKVQEQNRNQFTFGGGVSGLEGAFLNASFQTANFLGLGENFTVSAQTGKRTKNYQIAITEPYFLDRPITAGIDLFKRKITYVSYVNYIGYTQEDTGVSLTTGLPAGRQARAFVSYSYQVINLSQLDTAGVTNLVGTTNPITGQPVAAPVIDPGYLGGFGRRVESRVIPSWVRNTVDNPYTPRNGSRVTASVGFVGGPLGGTVNYFRPSVEMVRYIPTGKKTSFGLRLDGSWTSPFSDTKVLPYYLRFFLGGENQIRGYNIRTVGPVAPDNVSIGGTKYALFNAEYYFDIFGPVRLLLFYDAGQAFLENQSINVTKFQDSTGVELRFLMPVLNVPFRLIYAWNPHNRPFYQPATAFKFAVGTTF
jgi:outer membrane protein insertion porin family